MRVTVKGLLQSAAILTVLLSVVTLLPVEHHALQLFTHFRLQYLGASLVLLVALAMLREPRYTIALALVALLNANFVLPWYFDKRPSAAGTEIKVILANVLASNDDPVPLLSLIEAEQPDLVFLLEISPRWAAELPVLGESFTHSVVEPRDGKFGIAMYSQLPVTAAASIDSSPLGYPTIVATLEVGGQSLQVVGTHPMIPVGVENYDARNSQLDAVARLLQKAGGPRLLVGDLNATIWDRQYGSLENRTWLRNVRQGFGLLPTWPTFMPPAMIPIDHMLVSEEIGVKDVRTGPAIGSDHLPLIATITL
jgi:endonuclease/exonuclease/phosphatase (EEP) superfamily protein YafD